MSVRRWVMDVFIERRAGARAARSASAPYQAVARSIDAVELKLDPPVRVK